MAGLSGSSGNSSFFNVIKSQGNASNGDAAVTSLVDAKPKHDTADVIPTPTPKDNKLPNQPAKVEQIGLQKCYKAGISLLGVLTILAGFALTC